MLLIHLHMTTQSCVNIGSGNGLVRDSTKLLPEPNVDLLKVVCGIHLRAISRSAYELHQQQKFSYYKF